MHNKDAAYNGFIYEVLNSHLSPPRTHQITTFEFNSPWGSIIYRAMAEAERVYVRSLLNRLKAADVGGAIVEFGSAPADLSVGLWIKFLRDTREELDLSSDVWGFDSFEGLPKPGPRDLDCWHEGDYANDYETVTAMLGNPRPWLHLVKGWFADTLRRPEVAAIDRVMFARVDCDLYESARECLAFLSHRLVDNAILVFDDWTFDLATGETRAFHEWVPQVPHLRFEFLDANGMGHFYLRVHHR